MQSHKYTIYNFLAVALWLSSPICTGPREIVRGIHHIRLRCPTKKQCLIGASMLGCSVLGGYLYLHKKGHAKPPKIACDGIYGHAQQHSGESSSAPYCYNPEGQVAVLFQPFPQKPTRPLVRKYTPLYDQAAMSIDKLWAAEQEETASTAAYADMLNSLVLRQNTDIAHLEATLQQGICACGSHQEDNIKYALISHEMYQELCTQLLCETSRAKVYGPAATLKDFFVAKYGEIAGYLRINIWACVETATLAEHMAALKKLAATTNLYHTMHTQRH